MRRSAKWNYPAGSGQASVWILIVGVFVAAGPISAAGPASSTPAATSGAALSSARDLLKQRRWADAEAAATRALGICPEKDAETCMNEALLVRGVALYGEGRIQEAASDLGKALEHRHDTTMTLPVADGLRFRGLAAYRLGDPSADVWEQRALAAYVALGDRAGQANAELALGSIYRFQGRSEDASRYLLQALHDFTALGDRRNEALSRLFLGRLSVFQGKFEDAAAFYQQAIIDFTAVGDASYLAQAHCRLGELYLTQGQLEQASAVLREAIGDYEELHDQDGLADARQTLGSILFQEGRVEEAANLYRQALDGFAAVGNLSGMAGARLNLGGVSYAQGRFDEGAEVLEQALADFTTLKSEKGVAGCKMSLGIIRRDQGRSEDAIEMLRQALSGYKAMGNSQGQADVTVALATVRFHQGKFDEAAALHAQALAQYTALGDLLGQAKSQAHLAEVRLRQGRPDEASELFKSALTGYTEKGSLTGRAFVQLDLALLCTSQGKFEEADMLLTQALSAFTTAGIPLSQANVYHAFGDLRRQQSRLEEASDLYAKALALYQKNGTPELIAKVYISLARLDQIRNQPIQAWQHAERGLRSVGDLLDSLRDEGSLRAYSEQNADMLSDLVEIALSLDHPDDALRVTLSLQGRGLLWSRALARAMAHLPAETATRVHPLIEARQEAALAAGQALTALLPADGDWSEHLTTLRTARQALDDAERSLRDALALAPEDTAPPTVAEFQLALARDPRRPVLVIYSHRSGAVRAWVLDGQTNRPYLLAQDPPLTPAPGEPAPPPGLPTVSEVKGRLATLLDPLVRAGTAPDEAARASALLSFSPNASARLYDILVRPWEAALACTPGPCRALLVVPDGDLHGVPFQALIRTPTPGQDLSLDPMGSVRTADFLGRATALSVLPTPGLLLERFQTPVAAQGALVLGSPEGAGLGDAEQKEVATAWARLRPRCAHGVPCPDGPLTGEEATDDALRDWLPRVSVAYLSAHGLSEFLHPEDEDGRVGISMLLLADALAPQAVADEGAGKGVLTVKGLTSELLASKGGTSSLRCLASGDDNCIFPEELKERFLVADLVVLSACASALGDPTVTEGFTGVSRALLTDGANTVLSSAWPVSTTATRDLMDRFTKARFKRGRATSDALLDARRSLQGDVEIGGQTFPLAHPFFWAGFTLYGYDGSSIPEP